MRGPKVTAMLAGAIALATPALAVEPDEVLDDPALEARAREIGRELRCVVCQSQSIDDSAAPLAKDLRLLVRERLAAGDTDQQVVDYVVARYGDYVLLKPPLRGDTFVLWAAPAAVFALGAAGAFFLLRRKEAPPAAPLSETEQRRLADLADE